MQILVVQISIGTCLLLDFVDLQLQLFGVCEVEVFDNFHVLVELVDQRNSRRDVKFGYICMCADVPESDMLLSTFTIARMLFP